MNSMTGYGRGQASHEGSTVTVELSSVNRRQTDLVLNLPRELESLEPRVRDEISRHLARGRLTLRIGLTFSDAATARRLQLNDTLARAYARAFSRLGSELGLPDTVTLDTVLRAPGVLQTAPLAPDPETLWPTLERALRQAIEALLRLRRREGRHLARDLRRRIASLRRLTATVRRTAPEVARRYRRQLLERIRSFGLESLDFEDERLLKEVALFAERSDISEELTRLEGHFQQFDEALRSPDPVGRLLDFLAQEMHREVNTLGAKANDSRISRAVVTMKAEVERFREQVQNIE